MKNYQRVKKYSPMESIKKSYDTAKDICRGLSVAIYGSYTNKDSDFASKCGIKPANERYKKWLQMQII